MKVFILEDSQSRIRLFKEIFGVYNITLTDKVDRAKELYEAYAPFDLILLDHDLADDHYTDQQREEGTGTEFATWLQWQPKRTPVIIHSYNPDGAARMETVLREAGWPVTRIPFGLHLIDILKKLKATKDGDCQGC